MIDARRIQLTFGDNLIAEEDGLYEDWMWCTPMRCWQMTRS